jgi:hypothetical protein
MFKIPAGKFSSIATLAGALFALTVFVIPAQAANLHDRMQQLADNAALAGVNTLGTSDARAEGDKRDAAVQATKQVIGQMPGVTAEVIASPENLTMTVTLASKTVAVASTARYVPPEQPANWAWASRQHFAIGRDPVVVGSTCAPSCGQSRFR